MILLLLTTMGPRINSKMIHKHLTYQHLEVRIPEQQTDQQSKNTNRRVSEKDRGCF